ncbi:MAG: hypothetical protein AAGK05_11840 [Pseudomonadota bacterium]
MWVAATLMGYAIHLQPYPGLAEKPCDDYDLGSSGNVVAYLAQKLRPMFGDRHVSMTFDNYFTSIQLVTYLRSLGYVATGTVRQMRIPSCPVNEKEMKKERGTIQSHHNDEHDVYLASWFDNRVVTVLSTHLADHPISQAKRYNRTRKEKVNVPRPASVTHYNNTMGGVDLLDSNVGQCRTSIRGKKVVLSDSPVSA